MVAVENAGAAAGYALLNIPFVTTVILESSTAPPHPDTGYHFLPWYSAGYIGVYSLE